MQIQGKILEIFDTVKVSDSFQKREFVVEYAENPSYPEYLKFEAIQDKCTILDQYNPGDQILVDFNLKGRKWTNKEGKVVYFNSLQAWKINAAESSMGAGPGSSIPDQPLDMDDGDSDTDNVLPF